MSFKNVKSNVAMWRHFMKLKRFYFIHALTSQTLQIIPRDSRDRFVSLTLF